MDDKQNNYAGNAKNTCDKCGKPVDGYFEYGKVEKPGEYIVKDKENHCADQGIQQQLKKEFKAKLKNFEYQEDNKQYDNKCYYTGPRHTQFLLWQQ